GRNGGHQGGGVDAELSLRLRRAESLFFACAKKSNQKKAQPGREPMRLRRIGPLRSSRAGGTAHNSLRSDTCASSPPVPLRCSARFTAGRSKAEATAKAKATASGASPAATGRQSLVGAGLARHGSCHHESHRQLRQRLRLQALVNRELVGYRRAQCLLERIAVGAGGIGALLLAAEV